MHVSVHIQDFDDLGVQTAIGWEELYWFRTTYSLRQCLLAKLCFLLIVYRNIDGNYKLPILNWQSVIIAKTSWNKLAHEFFCILLILSQRLFMIWGFVLTLIGGVIWPCKVNVTTTSIWHLSKVACGSVSPSCCTCNYLQLSWYI